MQVQVSMCNLYVHGNTLFFEDNAHSLLHLVQLQVTQLGQVKDLATAFHKILGNSKAKNQIYNISGARFVTFDGIAKACAKAAGAPEPELIHYNPKDFDFGGKKAFPLRDQHFFASIDKVRSISTEPSLLRT